MIFTQYYLACLSQASYLVADEHTRQAVLVDPRRDVDDYLADLERQNLTLVGVIDTHFHADFVAGHLELAAATGAWIGFGPTADPDFPIRRLNAGDTISLGAVQLEILETPGHTWESISLVVREDGTSTAPLVLTGDSLFIGDVGRPDLAASVGASPDELAHAMHASLHDVLLRLPDETRVFPGHGAGSACGRNLSSDLESTIGRERATNYALQIEDADEFARMLQEGQPAAPAYFAADAVLNRRDRPVRQGHAPIIELEPSGLAALLATATVTTIDTRSADAFAAGHLAGSINVGLDGRFAETAGMVVPVDARVVLVTETGSADEAAIRLARIGIDHVVGWVDATVLDRPPLVALVQRVERADASDLAAFADAFVLDVRSPSEHEDGGLPGSVNIPLAEIARRIDEIPAGRSVLVHCAAGWRSSVAASVLRQHRSDVVDLRGGYGAWQLERLSDAVS